MSDLVGFLQIVGSSVGDFTEEPFLRTPPAQDKTDPIDKLSSGVEFGLIDEILGEPQRPFRPGDNCEFEQRIGSLQVPGDHGMAWLVDGYSPFLLRTNYAFPLNTSDDPLGGHFQVMGIHWTFTVSGC